MTIPHHKEKKGNKEGKKHIINCYTGPKTWTDSLE
jgi:hypothetical protein